MREITDHDFVASGEYFRNKSSIPVVIHGTYSEFEHKPVRCLVIPDKTEQNSQIVLDEHATEDLKGIAQDGENVWISELTFTSSHGFHDSFYWEGTAENFIKGNLEEFDATEGKIFCNLFIPPTPLAQTHGYMCNFDGTIGFEHPSRERKGVSWTTKYGSVELIDGYSYAKHQIGIDSAIIRIQRCQISFEIRHNGYISLASVFKECTSMFDDALWLASLLSRKRLAWYAGDAVFIPNDNNVKTPFQKATIRRNLHLGYESSMGHGEYESDLLIHPDKLKTGLFQELLTNYTNSKYRDAIQRAIMYILMSYEKAYFEAYIGIIYLALETLVAGLSVSREKENTKILDATSLKQLLDQLERAIRQETKDEKAALGLIDNLVKINFRKSPSLANRLFSLLQQSGVPLKRLWPSGVNVEKKLREIIGRRDLYIHKGEIGDFDEYLYDFERLRTLVELWILKLLNCQDDAINQHHLSNLVPIDRIDSPVSKG
jgi:hypothetical protein